MTRDQDWWDRYNRLVQEQRNAYAAGNTEEYRRLIREIARMTQTTVADKVRSTDR